MNIKSIRWLGTRTEKFDEMVTFYKDVLGLPQSHSEEGFAAFDMQNGDRVEVFSLDYQNHSHFTTGPVGGFEVENIETAKKEMEEKGIKFLSQIEGNSSKWAHFEGPDGNVYELTQPAKK